MSVVLAFDCAVSGLDVALLRGGVVLAHIGEGGRDQAARLLPVIETAIARSGIDRREIALLAVTTGPGSFTGIRVGLAAARGLSLGFAVPVAGIPTTTVLLAQADRTGRMPVAAIDSRLGDWFCALDENAAMPFVASPEMLASRLRGGAWRVVGSGAPALAAALAERGVDAEGREGTPDAAVLARLAATAGADAWRERNRSEGLPRPLYLRGVNITLPNGARRTVDG